MKETPTRPNQNVCSTLLQNMASTAPTTSPNNTTPPTTPDSITGNVVFISLVAILASTVLIPMLQNQLPRETLSNIAIGSMGVIGALASGAAGWHFRGKMSPPQADAQPTPPNANLDTQANTQSGNITVLQPPTPAAIPDPQSPAPGAATPVNTPQAPHTSSGVPNESNPTGRPA